MGSSLSRTWHLHARVLLLRPCTTPMVKYETIGISNDATSEAVVAKRIAPVSNNSMNKSRRMDLKDPTFTQVSRKFGAGSVWRPIVQLVIRGKKKAVTVSAYLDMNEERSYISSNVLSSIDGKLGSINVHGELMTCVRVCFETLDAFCESKKCSLLIKSSRKARPVLLGRDFIAANRLRLDYVARTCRWDSLAYDVFTQSPMLVTKPNHSCSSRDNSLFMAQLQDVLFRKRQEIAPLCEPTTANMRKWVLDSINSRIQYLEGSIKDHKVSRQNHRLPEQISGLKGHDPRVIERYLSSSSTKRDVYDSAWACALSSKAHRRRQRMRCISDFSLHKTRGGGKKPIGTFSGKELAFWTIDGYDCEEDTMYEYFQHYTGDTNAMNIDDCVVSDIPLSILCASLSKRQLSDIMVKHELFTNVSRATHAHLHDLLKDHEQKLSPCCIAARTFFRRRADRHQPTKTLRKRSRTGESDSTVNEETGLDNAMHLKSGLEGDIFPPPPPSDSLKRTIVRDFCEEISEDNLLEDGCAVCGCLNSRKHMVELRDDLFDKNILLDPTNRMTRAERRSSHDPVRNIPGPMIAKGCKQVCKTCLPQLKKGKLPKLALANGNWLGEVPEELKNLTFMERMLIARVRHNACVLKVHASGQFKMKANAVMFSVPMPKVYRALPPSKEEFEEIMAFIFIGPEPTQDMHKRLPSFVRRNAIRRALEWLKLNHEDYSDLEISEANLAQYPEEGPPVIPDYRPRDADTELENKAVYDMEDWSATSEGECPLIVHTLTLEQLMAPTVDTNTLMNAAKAHFLTGGAALAIGRSASPESIFTNPQLYPKVFPWLFPYGLGGIGNKNGHSVVGDQTRKRALLMYYDKRFQKDPVFSLVALNHEQIKSSTTGSFVTVKKASFDNMKERILNADVGAMDEVIEKVSKGGQLDLSTEAEKSCFNIINDLDHVGKFVQGSRTQKRYMRNEIWSLIAARGAPSWFITFAPMDQRHPVSIYNASDDTTFFPQLFAADDRAKMIGNNATACARFFKFMVKAFIKHVLGVNSGHDGLFGETEGYYGTVEEQGRLTLHLHTMIWIKGALTPQQIRDRLTAKDGDFQIRLVKYLEGCHRGSFLTGSGAEVEDQYKQVRNNRPWKEDPSLTVPEAPPAECPYHTDNEETARCRPCFNILQWNGRFKGTVDELLHRFNVHDCTKGYCKNPKYPNCKARFPRDRIAETTIDPDSGYLRMRHGEPMLNTYNEALTYLMKSNTDVTSLLSGTALKAVIAYTTDYITKPGLRTHTMMEIIKSVFTRNSEFLQGDSPRAEKARKLMVQIVNALTVKQEIGSPMACAYLLGHPDHYTNYRFKPFYWRMFLADVKKAWGLISKEDKHEEPSVILSRTRDDSIVANSPLIDYELRPIALQPMSLYDWVRLAVKEKKPERRKHKAKPGEKQKAQSEESGLAHEHTEPVTRNTRSMARNSTYVLEEEDHDSGYETDETLIANDADDEDYDEDDDPTSDIDERPSRTSKSRNGSGVFEFQEEHPQRSSHHIRLLPEEREFIPNFVGGSLPRRDKGDLDEYYRTMLMLFKPWNDPLSLKEKSQTWHEAFRTYGFTDRQVKIMSYFHVKYECNDARDDFRAQRVAAAKTLGMNWVGGQFIQELDKDAVATDKLDMLNDDVSGIDTAFEPEHIGRRTANATVAMASMKHALESVGWNSSYRDTNGTESRTVNTEGVELNEDQIMSSGDDEFIIDPNARTLNMWKELLAEKRKAVIAEKIANVPNSDGGMLNNGDEDQSFWEDQVRRVDKSFLTRNFRASERDDDGAKLMDDIVDKFTLNKEQERAFRIIANHSLVGMIADPLKMYIGGMAGTGKSQVIKALIQFFESKGKSYAFLILAPTGSAASLVSGSTYHSVLGFRGSNKLDEDGNQKADNLAKGMSAQDAIRSRIRAVDYVFVDEISMVDCLSLYNISGQMNLAMRLDDVAFAGKSMIFAGDFAQLPPLHTAGPALYSGLVSSVIHTTNSVITQKKSIGKALWHQFTVVVLLTQNMRQRSQSEEDARFRKLLVNLRMNSCDRDDIELMHSRVPRADHPDIDLHHPDFFHASMITCWNANRDLLNEIGVQKFSSSKKKELHTFYAVDTFSNVRANKGKSTIEHNPVRAGNQIPKQQAEKLLMIQPGNTMHIPGKLFLCKGLPVILKRNDATELNVTNGAEGFVRDWKSNISPNGRQTLDVVFVELKSPPTPVKLDGLPINVVPVCRQKQQIVVRCPDDSVLSINRDQVPLLPNFAMTDYASQGRTRPVNIVDLEHCRNHQSVYTCLSRASTLKGTVIFRMCPQGKITGGLSGFLKQEFRELELLNEITKLRWEGTLQAGVGGNTRSTLLKSYMKVYGKKKCPSHVHSAIKWGRPGDSALSVDYDDDEDFVWKNFNKSGNAKPQKKTSTPVTKTAGGTESVKTVTITTKTYSTKRKNNEPDNHPKTRNDIVRPTKKRRSTGRPETFRGLRWRKSTQTCAYDSILTIISNIYYKSPYVWNQKMTGVNTLMGTLVTKWLQVLQDITFNHAEEARDSLQKTLHMRDPYSFPQDATSWTDMGSLLRKLLEDEGGNRMHYQRSCSSCGKTDPFILESPTWSLPAKHTGDHSLTIEIKKRFNRISDQPCTRCSSQTVKEEVKLNAHDPPPLIAIQLEDTRHTLGGSVSQPKLTATVSIGDKDEKVLYNTRGLVYWDNTHFTCRLVDKNKEVYYNDGITTGTACIHEGKLKDLPDPHNCRGMQLTYIILSLI